MSAKACSPTWTRTPAWDLPAPEALKAGELLRTEPSKRQGDFPMGAPHGLFFNRQVESHKQESLTIPINFNTVAFFILKLRKKNSLLMRIPLISLSHTTLGQSWMIPQYGYAGFHKAMPVISLAPCPQLSS